MQKLNLLLVLTVCAALGCGLMGGVLFAFSDFVMTALAHQPTASAVATMQAINKDILNPPFYLLFFGTPALVSVVALLCWATGHPTGRVRQFLFVGSAFYLLGTLGVTVAFNIPLNDRLSLLNAETTAAAQYWPAYFSAWMTWNHVRTVASVSASACLILAIHGLGDPREQGFSRTSTEDDRSTPTRRFDSTEDGREAPR